MTVHLALADLLVHGRAVTPAELIDKLCDLHGVDNPNQLAPLIGMAPADLYSWRNKHAPNFENTLKLLEAAGVLNFESPSPPVRAPGIAEQMEDVLRRVQELERQAQSRQRRRPANGRQ